MAIAPTSPHRRPISPRCSSAWQSSSGRRQGAHRRHALPRLAQLPEPTRRHRRLAGVAGHDPRKRRANDDRARRRRHRTSAAAPPRADAKSCRREPVKSGAALLALAGHARRETNVDTVLKVGGRREPPPSTDSMCCRRSRNPATPTPRWSSSARTGGRCSTSGATTFWEDFNLEWTANAARIDELVPRARRISTAIRRLLLRGVPPQPLPRLGKRPHGVAQSNVLGVDTARARLQTRPHRAPTGQPEMGRGRYPTPLGPIRVRHERNADGTLRSQINAPPGIQVESPSNP